MHSNNTHTDEVDKIDGIRVVSDKVVNLNGLGFFVPFNPYTLNHTHPDSASNTPSQPSTASSDSTDTSDSQPGLTQQALEIHNSQQKEVPKTPPSPPAQLSASMILKQPTLFALVVQSEPPPRGSDSLRRRALTARK
jgi:hypothetical protein